MKRLAQMAVLVALLFLAGCANSPQFVGIPLSEGRADASLQELAQKAMAGDKQAQLQLAKYHLYASGGRGLDEQAAMGDSAQASDMKFVNDIWKIDTKPKDIKKFGSLWSMRMTYARELLEMAATDTGGEKLQVVPASNAGGSVTVSRFSTGPLQKGLPEAAKLLPVVNKVITGKKYETNFDSTWAEVCESEYYDYSDWQREAYFIVEGTLTTVYTKPPYKKVQYSREGPYYEAKIEIDRFLKWPDDVPKPDVLNIADYVRYGTQRTEYDEGRFVCSSWAPPALLNRHQQRAVIILQYYISSSGDGSFGDEKFRIVTPMPPDSVK